MSLQLSTNHRQLEVEALESRLALDASSFVTGLYHDLLGRAPDPAGLSFWVSRIQGGESHFDVATDIWRSPEHRGVQVDSFYRIFLNRAADAGGRAHWVSDLVNGVHNELGVEFLFVTSPEYINLHSTPDAYITGLYLNILGRTPTLNEQVFWQNVLATSGAGTVAADILTSTESFTDVIDQYYSEYLGRSPDVGGLSNWLALLQSNRATVESVGEGILGSAEYANLH